MPPRTHADGEQTVTFHERVAPIGIDALGKANRIRVSFGADAPMYRRWLCDSIAAIHVKDAHGAWVDEATPDALGTLDLSTIDWLLGEAITAALEIPLS